VRHYQAVLVAALSLTPMLTSATRSFARVDQDYVNQLMGAANQGCLVGSEYGFQVDAHGVLEILKRSPGGSLTAVARVYSQPGAAGFLDQSVKALMYEKMMACLKPRFDVIFAYFEKNPPDQPQEVVEMVIVEGPRTESHVGDPPGDGAPAKACVDAAVAGRWTIYPKSGYLVLEGLGGNGNTNFVEVPNSGVETPTRYCGSFYVHRKNDGFSASAYAHARAVQTRTIKKG
jgi:hypothetical protein